MAPPNIGKCLRHGVVELNSSNQCPRCLSETENVRLGSVKSEFSPLASPRPYRFDLIDPNALLRLARVMHDGITSHPGPDTWRKLDVEFHLNRAVTHIQLYRSGNREIDHLAHAFTRLMMAIGVEVGDGGNGHLGGCTSSPPPPPLT